MAKQSFTSEKYQAVIRVMNRGIAAGVSNADIRQYVVKRFNHKFPGSNEGSLDGVAMTMKGLSTYIANVKAENGMNTVSEQRPVATIIKRDNPVRSICMIKDGIVTKVCYTTATDMLELDIPKDTACIYGYQICGAPIGTVIDSPIQLSKEQELILKPAKSK